MKRILLSCRSGGRRTGEVDVVGVDGVADCSQKVLLFGEQATARDGLPGAEEIVVQANCQLAVVLGSKRCSQLSRTTSSCLECRDSARHSCSVSPKRTLTP